MAHDAELIEMIEGVCEQYGLIFDMEAMTVTDEEYGQTFKSNTAQGLLDLLEENY
jgi:hypothetical protein